MTPNFAASIINPFGLVDVGLSAKPVFVDIDGDQDLEAFVGNNNGQLLYFQNTGSSTAPAFASPATPPFGLADAGLLAAPSFADIDGDGDLDAFVGNNTGDILFFENTGNATSPAFAPAVSNPFGLSNVGYHAAPTFVDIDGDGDLDAFIGEAYGNTLFFMNTGSASAPAFASAQSNPFGLDDVGYGAAPSFADIDGDVDLDALIGNNDGQFLLFMNSGSATAPAFAAAQTNPFGLANAGYHLAPAFADIDGDGDPDVLIGNDKGSVVLFGNTAANASPVPAPSLVFAVIDTPFKDNFVPVTGMVVATDADSPALTYDLVGGVDNGDGSVSLGNQYGTLTLVKATGGVNFIPDGAVIEPLGVDVNLVFPATVSDGVATPVALSIKVNVLQAGATETEGDDVLTGTAGNDHFTSLGGNDTLEGLGGNDTLDGGTGVDTASYASAAAAVQVSLAIATAQDTGSAGSDTLVSIENLSGSAFNDTLTGDASDNALAGGAGNDLLEGLDGTDEIDGGDGIDTASYQHAAAPVDVNLTLAGAQDTGGAGSDTLLNIENLLGSDFNDMLTGDAKANRLNGGSGADTLIGGLGNDTYYVDNANDVATEASNGGTADTVFSKLASYTLKANIEIGHVDGSGNFNLTGNTLANSLFGGTGKNMLTGGLGADKLTGGSGADRFDFNLVSETGLTATTRDQLLDFSHAQGDKIDLLGIDANTGKAGDQAFTKLVSSNTAFSASKSFTAAGQLYFDQKAHVLYGNVDADATPEFSIKVMGPVSLVPGDFLL